MSEELLKKGVQNNKTVTGECVPEDNEPVILSLRPDNLEEYIGQAEAVETLKIAIAASRKRNEPLDHVLFHGPPGLGKTTLAHIIAHEMNGRLTVTSGPALEKGGDLIGILTHLDEGDVLFIDEIHRMPKTVEEFLYPAMEDFAVDFIFDKGVHARSHRFALKRFTLVGATTRVGLLSAPLRDRFGIFGNLDFYSEEDLVLITKRSARLLEVDIDEEGARELSRRSRGTPRILNRLLKWVRDFTQVKADGRISREIVMAALKLFGVDEKGLTPQERRYIRTLIEFYNGGPAGIDAIAATLQEETDTLVDFVEPYLLKIGFIIRTPSGRKTSESAGKHLRKMDRCF